MNRLSNEDRAKILHMLCEGMSIRAIARLTGASKNTVAKLLVDAGKACAAYYDANVRNVAAKRVLVDEVWSFTYAKQKNVASAKDSPEGVGDTWTWTAVDADTKLIISYLVGGRDAEYAIEFIQDLADRVANCFQLTSDVLNAYIGAVEDAFGDDIDFAQLVKVYGKAPGAPGRYGPPECIGSQSRRVRGKPDMDYVATSYVERQNLTMRMHMRRFTRLTNAFSKKVENHVHTVALHMMYYNFVRIHNTLCVTPAMTAGITDRFWEIADIAKLVEDVEVAPKASRPLQKRNGENEMVQ
jgi:IS1 family transposase